MYLVKKDGDCYTVRDDAGTIVVSVSDRNIALDVAHALEFARQDRLSNMNPTGMCWPVIVDSPIDDRPRSIKSDSQRSESADDQS